MNQLAKEPQTRAIVIEDVLPHTPEKVWRVLTEPQLLARWLMKNTFAPEVGHRFTFEARPMGDWDGIVQCQVLEIDPPRRLVYSWVGGSDANNVHGTRLDSVLSIDLTPVAGGTRMRLVHDGFRSPQNDAGYDAMSSGWGGIIERIEVLAREA